MRASRGSCPVAFGTRHVAKAAQSSSLSSAARSRASPRSSGSADATRNGVGRTCGSQAVYVVEPAVLRGGSCGSRAAQLRNAERTQPAARRAQSAPRARALGGRIVLAAVSSSIISSPTPLTRHCAPPRTCSWPMAATRRPRIRLHPMVVQRIGDQHTLGAAGHPAVAQGSNSAARRRGVVVSSRGDGRATAAGPALLDARAVLRARHGGRGRSHRGARSVARRGSPELDVDREQRRARASLRAAHSRPCGG